MSDANGAARDLLLHGLVEDVKALAADSRATRSEVADVRVLVERVDRRTRDQVDYLLRFSARQVSERRGRKRLEAVVYHGADPNSAAATERRPFAEEEDSAVHDLEAIIREHTELVSRQRREDARADSDARWTSRKRKGVLYAVVAALIVGVVGAVAGFITHQVARAAATEGQSHK